MAAALGLAMVYPQLAEARLAPEYRHALERLAAAAAARGPAGGGRFRELPLMLVPAMSAAAEGGAAAAGSSSSGGSSGGGQAASGGGGGELGGCAADGAAGLLVAPLGVTGDQLYSAVQQLGGQVLSAAAAARRRQQELEALRKQVERKVMLRWGCAMVCVCVCVCVCVWSKARGGRARRQQAAASSAPIAAHQAPRLAPILLHSRQCPPADLPARPPWPLPPPPLPFAPGGCCGTPRWRTAGTAAAWTACSPTRRSCRACCTARRCGWPTSTRCRPISRSSTSPGTGGCESGCAGGPACAGTTPPLGM